MCILGRALGQDRCGKRSKTSQRKANTWKNDSHVSDLNHFSGTLPIKEDAHILLWVCIPTLVLL